MAQGGLLVKYLVHIACKLLCAAFHCSVAGVRVLSIRTSSDEKDNHNNLEKMSFKGLSEGSSNAAGEEELCDEGGCETAFACCSMFKEE